MCDTLYIDDERVSFILVCKSNSEGRKMKVIFAGDGWSYEFACEELTIGYRKIIRHICNVADSFSNFESEKTLVVVRSCPCCHNPGLGEYRSEKFIMVSPLCGIDKIGLNIHTPSVYPPFRTPGVGSESATTKDFLLAWKETIEKAIKEASEVSP